MMWGKKESQGWHSQFFFFPHSGKRKLKPDNTGKEIQSEVIEERVDKEEGEGQGISPKLQNIHFFCITMTLSGSSRKC